MTEKTITITCTDDASANLRESAERRKIRGYRNLRFTGMTDLEFAEILSPYEYNVDELFETGPDDLVEDLFDTAADKENASQSAQDLAYVHTFQLDDVLASIGRFADAGGPDQHISMLAGMGRKMLAEIQETLAVQFENRVGETNDQNEEVTP